MKIKFVAPVGIAAVAFGMVAAAGSASAANNIKPFGQQEALNEIGYTVKGLHPSSDPVPHNGQLYAATIKVEGLGGWANPITAFFNARAESGANYRVIGGNVPSAPPGGTATGKLYFDVVGDVPNSVVYNDGMQDLMVWVPGPQIGGTPSEAMDMDEGPAGTSETISTPPAESAAPAEVGTPTGGGGNLVTPDVIAPAPFDLSEADVAAPGYNAGSGRR